MPFELATYLQIIVDYIFARLAQPVPGKDQLNECKLISHRGDFDNKTVFENTIAAFEKVHEHGVWGIELDIRWTKDLVPVVFHDPDLKRMFGSDARVCELTFAEFKKIAPIIPSLEETIEKLGKKLHFMVEVKEEQYPDPINQNRILKELFASLEPEVDFHLLSLTPNMFSIVNFIEDTIFFPIAWYDIFSMSRLSIENNYCAIAGHYLLLSNAMMRKHRAQGQKIGTGFPSSKNVLFREMNRGVDWIFTNHAVELQKIRDQYLKS